MATLSLSSATLAAQLEACIDRRTGRQVRDLRVLLVDDQIILRGRSRSYHVKQLAQEAALAQTDAQAVLVNQIEVF